VNNIFASEALSGLYQRLSDKIPSWAYSLTKADRLQLKVSFCGTGNSLCGCLPLFRLTKTKFPIPFNSMVTSLRIL